MTQRAVATVAQCARDVRAYTDAVRPLQGRPQQLTIVNDTLYWTQGIEQELYAASLPHARHTHHDQAHRDDATDARDCDDVACAARRVLVDAPPPSSSRSTAEASLTREEVLLRERTRTVVSGITSFRVRACDEAVFFVRGVRLYVYYTRGPRACQPPLDVFAYATATSCRVVTHDDNNDNEATASAPLPAGKPCLYIQHVTSTPPHERRRRTSSAAPHNDDDDDNEAAQLTTVGFVCDHNVYVATITETATTQAAAGDDAAPPLRVHVTRVTHIGDAQHECGVAEYIVQEEFGRLSGLVLSPRHVLYSYTDTSRMRQVTLLDGAAMARTRGDHTGHKNSHDNDDATTSVVETMSYPRVGDDNARCTLVVYERHASQHHDDSNNNNASDRGDGDATAHAHDTRQQQRQRRRRVLTRDAIAAALPSFASIEYMPRFGLVRTRRPHTSDSERDDTDEAVYVSVLDRTQTQYAVLSCPVASLPCVDELELRALYEDDDNKNKKNKNDKESEGNDNEAAAVRARLAAAVPACRVEWQQSIPWAWVEVPAGAPVHFGVDHDVLVCHASETATAHYHLYTRRARTRRDARNNNDNNNSNNNNNNDDDGNEDTTSAWRALTTGAWNVRPSSVRVSAASHTGDDEHSTHSRVTFVASAHGARTSVLYTLVLSDATLRAAPHDRDTLTRLSPLDEHVYSFCVSATHVCYVASTPTTPPQLYIQRIDVDADAAIASRVRVAVSPWMPTAPAGYLAVPPATDKASHSSNNSTISVDGKDGNNNNATCDDKDKTGDAAHVTRPRLLPLVLPSLVTVRSRRGCALGVHVFVSPMAAAAAAAPAPLAMLVYGGPHVQLVAQHDYDSACRATVQVLLQRGIHVAVADNQVSNANGLRDIAICKHNMGHCETSDYVDVVRALCRQAPCSDDDDGGGKDDNNSNSNSDNDKVQLPAGFSVDAARVAIFGWSYGGYATLLAMCQAPQTFKMGFAGAPVGDWRLYDTGYTERYMGLLYSDDDDSSSNNKKDDKATRTVSRAYTHSCIAHFADGFPDEANRLYIAHGMLDENVHLAHTCHIIDALVAKCKPYAALLYPGERHGLRQNVQSRIHHEAMLVHIMSTSL